MAKPIIFISRSFEDEDKKHIEFFEKLLGEEFVILEGEKGPENSKGEGDIYSKSLKKIDESDALFAIFSRRERIRRGVYVTSPSIIFETGYAFGKKKQLFGIREKGVGTSHIGMMKFYSDKGTESSIYIPEFQRDSGFLESKEGEFRQLIRSVKEKVEKKIFAPYFYSLCNKEVIICNGGYGQVRLNYTIRVQQENLPHITSTDHYFELGASAKKDSRLPSLTVMRAGNPAEARSKNRYFFTFKVLTNGITMKPIPITESAKRVKFKFRFLGSFKKDQEIQYEWLAQGPDLFPTLESDMGLGLREKDLDYVESNFVLPLSHIIEKFTFAIKFENGVDNLFQAPIYKIQDQEKNSLKDREQVLLTDSNLSEVSTLYTTYMESFENISVPKCRISAQWKPK